MFNVGGRGIIAYGVSDLRNHFYIGAITPTNTGTKEIITKNALTPEEASKIDAKMDDGSPLTGLVTAAGGSNLNGDVIYHDIAWGEHISPYELPMAIEIASRWLVPAAHATGTSTSVSRDACIFKIAAEGDSSAHYAVAAGNINCQLRLRWN
ncbi:MAG: hypothetical protein MK052_08985 [Alphaproteobacteria bacterium]|nr:hypothetical protein [Alphaproteobacteria bacterium]